MTDISFASPSTYYGDFQATIATAGGRVPPKGDIVAAPANVSVRRSDDPATMNMVSEFRYSKAVRARFYTAVCLLLAAAGFSALALVRDNEKLGLVAAFVLSMSAIFALAWLERADHERSTFRR